MNKLLKFIRESVNKTLVTESKKNIIVDKIGLSESLADWLINISDKYSIWFANDFKKSTINSLGENSRLEPLKKAVLRQISNNNPSGAILKLINKVKEQKEGEYRYISDWLVGRGSGIAVENDKINFKQLTFDEAIRRATEWHNRISELSKENIVIEDSDGDVVMKFSDGYYWINLGYKYCEKEGQAMGHCGRGEGNLFSLRREGRPFITADILSDGTIRQMRGRANTKPKKDYHPYIIKFILSDFVTNFDYWNYKEKENFKLSDLTEQELESVIDKKPTLVGDELFETLPIKKILKMIYEDDLIVDIESYVVLKNRMDFEELKEFYQKKPSAFDCFIPHLKFENYNFLNQSLGKKFTENGIILQYEDWSDEDLLDLFHEDEKDSAKNIVTYSLDIWDDYIMNYDIKQLDVPKISKENIKKIVSKLKSNNKISNEVINNIKSQEDIINIISDHSLDLENDIKRALTQAQSSAREDGYFQLFIKAITNFLGPYEFVDNKLTFKLSYKILIDILDGELMKDEEVNDLNNYKNKEDYIESMLGEFLRETENNNINPLRLNEPYNGVMVDADEEFFNELLYEEL